MILFNNTELTPQTRSELIEKALGCTVPEKISNAVKLMDLRDRAPNVVLRGLREIVGEIAFEARPYAPCHKGCAHCCHIPVELDTVEAAQIGRAIGVKPSAPKHYKKESRGLYQSRKQYKTGTPCVFLANNECSIYEQRPLVCRQQISLADTSAPCDTRTLATVPYLNARGIVKNWFAYLYFEKRADLRLADIREFFPNGLPARINTDD